MAIRFRSARRSSTSSLHSSEGFSEGWAAVAVLALIAMGVLGLSGGGASPRMVGARADPTEEILSSLRTAERSLADIEAAFESLCQEPVLLALELEPDCETGSMTLPDAFFEGNMGTQLTKVAQEDVGAAVTTYLARLRRMPALWESLEAIEIRGHADPRALRNPYETNLVGSQQRALGVLLFLVGPTGLSEADRADLQRLATVSGASFSRPPIECAERSRECYVRWRRVEIRPVLSEPLRRGDWSRTVEDVRVITRRAQDKMGEPRP